MASGKSTLGRGLAEALDSLYLDTGVMYRGLTALALSRQIDMNDEAAIAVLAQSVRFSFPELAQVGAVNPPLLADGTDITSLLRTPEVDRLRLGGIRATLRLGRPWCGSSRLLRVSARW